jgi:hypothetical protein
MLYRSSIQRRESKIWQVPTVWKKVGFLMERLLMLLFSFLLIKFDWAVTLALEVILFRLSTRIIKSARQHLLTMVTLDQVTERLLISLFHVPPIQTLLIDMFASKIHWYRQLLFHTSNAPLSQGKLFYNYSKGNEREKWLLFFGMRSLSIRCWMRIASIATYCKSGNALSVVTYSRKKLMTVRLVLSNMSLSF